MNELRDIKHTLKVNNSRFDVLCTEIKQLKKETYNIHSKVISETYRALPEVKSDVDDLEQYGRRPCIRVHGLQHEDDEDIKAVVVNLINKMGINITKAKAKSKASRAMYAVIQKSRKLELSVDIQLNTLTIL